MRGIPVVKVDENLPICPHCEHNVEVIGGIIQPHPLKYTTLGVEFADDDGKARRRFQLATAYCRRSGRQMPGMKVERPEPESPVVEEEYQSVPDMLLNFLFDRVNEGFTTKDLSYALDIRIPGDGRLDKKLVDTLLTKEKNQGMPEGYDLRHIQIEEHKKVWAMVSL